MRRKVATAFCALALAWVAGPALAGDILYSVMPAGAETSRAAQPNAATTEALPSTGVARSMAAPTISTIIPSPDQGVTGEGGASQGGRLCPNCEAGEEGCCHLIGAV